MMTRRAFIQGVFVTIAYLGLPIPKGVAQEVIQAPPVPTPLPPLDLESWISEKVAEKFDRAEKRAFVTGGVKCDPRDMPYTDSHKTSNYSSGPGIGY